jgi:hypothetical protein
VQTGLNLVIYENTMDCYSPHFSEMVSPRDLKRIDISGIKIPQYATTVFLVKSVGAK